MIRSIKKVAVLGSGVMGSRIACHFAGIGVQVLLLDMLAKGAEASTKPRRTQQTGQRRPPGCHQKQPLSRL